MIDDKVSDCLKGKKDFRMRQEILNQATGGSFVIYHCLLKDHKCPKIRGVHGGHMVVYDSGNQEVRTYEGKPYICGRR